MPEFKLNNVDKSALKPGFMGEVEVEGVEGGKLLLVQVGKDLSAISPKCTHYGAPMSKGTLTADGRIVCPWHGSCFKVSTGDIEDAPGLDALYSFPVTVKDDAFIIQAEEKQITDGRRVPSACKSEEASKESVLIVGGGSGAIGALEQLREAGFAGKITVLSQESYLPIDRTKISKALITDPKKIALRDEAFFKSIDVDFHTDTVVKSVDFEKRVAKDDSGKEWPYTSIVLATGGTPKKLPMEGFKTLENIFTIRGISTAKDVVDCVGEDGGKKIVVIGSSFIGMEVANTLAGKKHEVTVVGMEKAPMERVMGEQVGASFQKILEKSGIKFRMDSSVESAKPSSSDSKKVGSVLLKGGENLEADCVILGVGVFPETTYLDKSLLEEDGSLLVDDCFRVKKLKDAYAIGDIATYPYKGPGANRNSTVRIEHWNVAQNSGRSVANHITTRKTPTPFIPIFWSALGIQLRYCGNTTDGYDDVVVQGSLEDNKFAAFYTKGTEVVAVATMQKDPVMTQASELMRRSAMPSKLELTSGVDILTVSVPKEVTI